MAEEKPVPTIQWQTIPHNDLKVGEELGKGGFGIVHRATWHGQQVAVKKLFLKSSFNNEAKIMAQYRFPNIITLYGVSIETGNNNYKLVNHQFYW